MEVGVNVQSWRRGLCLLKTGTGRVRKSLPFRISGNRTYSTRDRGSNLGLGFRGVLIVPVVEKHRRALGTVLAFFVFVFLRQQPGVLFVSLFVKELFRHKRLVLTLHLHERIGFIA